MNGSLWTLATVAIIGGVGVAAGLSGASSNADPANDSVAASLDAVSGGIGPLFGLLMLAMVGAIIIGAGRFQ
jgi:hypothetical protein